ncbi:NUDIX domain-containing protein [Hydrogenimonas sp.]
MAIVTPYLATDCIILCRDEEENELGIVLIERKNPPYGLALPGGFVEVGETVEYACVREVKEETGLDVELKKLVGVFSDPKRDPRFHTVSVVYVGVAYVDKERHWPKGGDDAKRADIYPTNEIPYENLAFDHAHIIKTALLRSMDEGWVF